MPQRRTTSLTTRLRPRERERIEKAAEVREEHPSVLMRRAALERAREILNRAAEGVPAP